MRKTKKLTLSAVLVAMGVALMALGTVTEVLDLSASVLASMLVAFVCIEIGAPYHLLVWLATSTLSMLLFPFSLAPISYLVAFGLWPILKGYAERAPRVFWIPIKLLFATVAIALVGLYTYLLTGLPLVLSDKLWLTVATYLLLYVAFMLYDVCITRLVRYYLVRLRPRFQHLLK